jgi:hypothetical protein
MASSDRNSQLKLFSIGVVVKDKEEGSDVIEVWPSETLPQVNGNIRDASTDYNTKGVNAQGVSTQTKLTGKKTIKATWKAGDDGNRITAPDVYANETVDLYRFGDTDQFYWTTSYREPSLRKQETVCYGYSNKSTQGKAFDKESSYWVEYSTKKGNKHIHFHTSKSDGERFAYDFIINPDDGSITLNDDNGNSFKIVSADNQIIAENSIGSKVDISGDNITAENKSGASVVLDGQDGTMKAPGNASVEAGANLNLKASNISFDAGSMSMNSGGSNTQMSFEGNMNFNGDMNFNGKMTVNGTFIYNGKELVALIHEISQK